MSEKLPLASDGKPGCPEIVWDGPYSMRCSLGARVSECARHGVFETSAPLPEKQP